MNHRYRSAAALGAVIAAGLASRAVESVFVPAAVGDVLWATAVVVALELVWPEWSPRRLGLVAYGIAAAIEFQQRWQPDWLVDLRSNRLVALVLGRGFLWGDLVSYAVGVLGGLLILRGLRSGDRTARW